VVLSMIGVLEKAPFVRLLFYLPVVDVSCCASFSMLHNNSLFVSNAFWSSREAVMIIIMLFSYSKIA
jgi:hypothetical protein